MSNFEVQECPECGGAVQFAQSKGITIALPNPGVRTVVMDCYECVQCGENIFNDKQALDFAKQVDGQIATEKIRS